MSVRLLALLLALLFTPLAWAQSDLNSASGLNDTQKLGMRIFEQRCGVCHSRITLTSKQFGPVLYKDLVDGNEDTIREFILNGSKGRMPGFKYGLQPSEINAIIEYLKTVPKPTKSGPANNGPTPMD